MLIVELYRVYAGSLGLDYCSLYQETVGVVLVMAEHAARVDLPELHMHLHQKLHRSKFPQVIVFMNQLPRSQANKVIRAGFAQRAGVQVTLPSA